MSPRRVGLRMWAYTMSRSRGIRGGRGFWRGLETIRVPGAERVKGRMQMEIMRIVEREAPGILGLVSIYLSQDARGA